MMDLRLNTLLLALKYSFLKENTFAFIGGTSNAKLNGNSIDSQVVYKVQTNDVLEIGQVTEGARGYLVFGHPLKIERIAESYSTHTRSGLGGFEGRALKSMILYLLKVMHLIMRI